MSVPAGLRSSAGRMRSEFALMFVCTIIGHSTDAPMPWSRSSTKSASVSPTTANFDAQYTPSQRMPTSPAIEAVLITWPPWPCSISRGTNVCTPFTTPQKFTPMVKSQSLRVDFAIGPKVAMPALLQTRCTAPKRRNVASASASTLAALLTSVGTPSASAPDFSSSRTAAPSAGSSRSASTILAPRAANARAMAEPMPPAPPVMTATRFLKGSIRASYPRAEAVAQRQVLDPRHEARGQALGRAGQLDLVEPADELAEQRALRAARQVR